MSKNIVICCDGTAKHFGSYKSNVALTVEKLIQNNQQFVCYDPGVGTLDFPKKSRINKIKVLMGKAFGYGIRKNIIDAYKFLMEHYDVGDNVFLFGFSRGAFTARALAGMLHKCGLIPRGSNNLIPYLSAIYYDRGNQELAVDFKKTFCRECKPLFIGVWDTVKSLGYFLKEEFSSNNLNHDVAHGYHAVAIDEKRKKFQVSLWNELAKSPEQVLKQVWFTGCHSDVGGGVDSDFDVPLSQRKLSDITLKWMLEMAKQYGLLLREGWDSPLNSDPLGAINPSREGAWKIWFPRTRKIPEGSLIHQSVIQRMKEMPDYMPQLPQQYKIEN